MARQKKERGLGLTRPALALVGGTVVLGAGGSVLGGIGGPVASAAQGGLTTFASFTPVLATGLGGFIVVRQLQNLEQHVKRQTKSRQRRR